jgi:hypothetical protein
MGIWTDVLIVMEIFALQWGNNNHLQELAAHQYKLLQIVFSA